MDKRIGNTEAQIDSCVHDETRTTSPEQTGAWYSYIVTLLLEKNKFQPFAQMCTTLGHRQGVGGVFGIVKAVGKALPFPEAQRRVTPAGPVTKRNTAKGLWLV